MINTYSWATAEIKNTHAMASERLFGKSCKGGERSVWKKLRFLCAQQCFLWIRNIYSYCHWCWPLCTIWYKIKLYRKKQDISQKKPLYIFKSTCKVTLLFESYQSHSVFNELAASHVQCSKEKDSSPLRHPCRCRCTTSHGPLCSKSCSSWQKTWSSTNPATQNVFISIT